MAITSRNLRESVEGPEGVMWGVTSHHARQCVHRRGKGIPGAWVFPGMPEIAAVVVSEEVAHH